MGGSPSPGAGADDCPPVDVISEEAGAGADDCTPAEDTVEEASVSDAPADCKDAPAVPSPVAPGPPADDTCDSHGSRYGDGATHGFGKGAPVALSPGASGPPAEDSGDSHGNRFGSGAFTAVGVGAPAASSLGAGADACPPPAAPWVGANAEFSPRRMASSEGADVMLELGVKPGVPMLCQAVASVPGSPGASAAGLGPSSTYQLEALDPNGVVRCSMTEK